MQFVTRAIEKFLTTDYQNFTDMMITAKALTQLTENFDAEDKARLDEIELWTHEKLKTSIYKLDRLVDPTKVTGDPTEYQYNITFKSDVLRETDDEREKLKIKIKSDELQNYLCNAIREVTEIVYRNFERYNDEFEIPDTNAEIVDDDKWS